MIDRARLQAVIEPVVSAHGAELCDFELKNENGWVLRIYVERLGALANKLSTKAAAVDLDCCSHIARDLSPALDVADPIPYRYHLEVGSPGVERPLRKPEDFARFIGEKAKLKLRTGVAGQKVLVGKLAVVEGNLLTLEDGAKSYAVPLDDVVTARLVFEFGPTPKPVSHAPKSSKKKRRA
jgi:ribosome maturation factor RimP